MRKNKIMNKNNCKLVGSSEERISTVCLAINRLDKKQKRERINKIGNMSITDFNNLSGDDRRFYLSLLK